MMAHRHLARNLAQVQSRIQEAALGANRDPNDVILVGVSKYYPVEAMLEAYQAGLRHFGENRVEEMQSKLPSFFQTLSADESPPTIHMIGHLQSRKVADALTWAQMIHAVDTLKLAQRIDRLAQRDHHPLRSILLACNVSGETTKSGFDVAGWQHQADKLNAFLDQVIQIVTLENVEVKGLMTMAPLVDDPQETRPFFQSLRQLQQVCAEKFPQAQWKHLSMGMTNDFDVAIEEGATLVRLGRAIFGPRSD